MPSFAGDVSMLLKRELIFRNMLVASHRFSLLVIAEQKMVCGLFSRTTSNLSPHPENRFWLPLEMSSSLKNGLQ